ncbi:MAG: glutamate--tRNA ligase family protein [Actinomycetota bacterium]
MLARLAPTPSGYLHQGNAVNFALVSDLARARGCDIALRIDDVDAPRARAEYLEDIFRVLEWLGIEWQVGPLSAEDMETWSQTRRMDHYLRARDELLAHTEYFYVCECSRSTRHASGCACDQRRLSLEADRTALRMRWRAGLDPVVWRRDGLPAFHLTSIVDDELLGVSLVVRGEDLREASDFQRDLSRFLPGDYFAGVHVVHHPLMRDRDGRKMSKSAGAGATPMMLTADMRENIRDVAARMRVELDRVIR